jgi:AbrB family looped-hinge helix DNA binding protein
MPHTAEVSKRGGITIPKPLRDASGIQEGQQYSFHDLGGGALLLSPRPSDVTRMRHALRGVRSSSAR